MQTIADLIRQKQVDVPVQCAYLELMSPNLAACAAEMVAAGAASIRVMPLFLGIGKHVKDDLPELIKSLRENHPAVNFSLLPTIGEDQRVLQLMAEIALDQA